MPIRELADAAGVRWRVWETTPTRGIVRPQFAGGWLTFESAAERRRLAPVPHRWAQATDAVLLELLARAAPVASYPSGPPRCEPASAEAGTTAPAAELELTVGRVREVLRTVEATLQRPLPG